MSYWLYVLATNGDYDKEGYYDGEAYYTLEKAKEALQEARKKHPECDIVICDDE